MGRGSSRVSVPCAAEHTDPVIVERAELVFVASLTRVESTVGACFGGGRRESRGRSTDAQVR